MLSDSELAAEIETDEAKPRKARTEAKKAPVIVIEGDAERKVSVRCIVDCEPWANDRPIKYWEVAEISIKEATLLEANRMAVILETPKKGI